MKLKRLELYGFKSFADRTTFEFEDSLSALVGPNGSGKSNVVDAIKWVLGERSAQKLRGAEMTNVIFTGSESRKPLNFAEVQLVIDNADGWLAVDYEEVCIRRRVDRTGQSEYRLNGKQCRLKDIRNLLLDTGVGTSSYSFIEQGQIDRLLRSSPKERRLVFEEAAGINRFLEQKREAERKLERVGNNLARVNDIVEEVQRQLRSVKYQAGRARTFKKQTERLLRLRLAHGLHSLRALQANRDEHSRSIAAAQAERDRLAEQAAAVEAELEAARDALQNAQNELAESRQRLTRSDARLESLARESELNRRRSDELQQRLEAIGKRLTSLEERASALEEELAVASADLESSGEELQRRTNEFAARQQRAEEVRSRCRATQETIESKKAEVFDLFQQEAHVRNQAEVLAAEKRALQNRLNRVESRQSELAQQLDRAEAERGSTHQKLEEIQAQQADLDARVAQLQKALAEAQQRLTAVATQESETKADLRGQLGRRDVLRDLEARAEGVHSGVRQLLEADLPGTLGIVAGVLNVPLELAAAVEAALGDKVQAVIIERAAEGKQALRLLSEEGLGRAELLILERLPAVQALDLAAGAGLLGRLSELVDFDERAARAVEFLLGNTFLAEDVAAAEALMETGLPRGIRLVTPTGELYGSEGIWAGGEPKAGSLISRRSELAELDGRIRQLQHALANLATQRQNCARQIEVLQAERDALASRVEQLRRNAGEISSHLQVVESRTSELREERHLARAEAASLSKDIEDLQAQSAVLQEQSDQVRRDRSQAQRAVEAEQQQLRAMQQEQQALAEEVTSLGGELARAREHERNLRSLVERLRGDRRHNEAELASLLTEREGSERRRRESQEAAVSAEGEAQALQREKAALAQTIEAESAALQERRQTIGALSTQAKETADRRGQLDEQLHSLRMAENETAIKMQDILERTAEDYGVRLQVLEKEPECWRDSPPFTAKLIREFTDDLPEKRPVAAWYREAQNAEDASEEAEDDLPEVVSLEEATELRRAVLELADEPGTNWEGVRTEVARLKAKVDRIGNVNVAAIRQQEELEMRLQFLTDQKEDLETARRHQREIIRELKKKSRERFIETFEQVQQNFQTLFRKLFGGGSADLILQQEEEETDVLEAGIEMVARPPGKETTSITLLSGGEKALTTVALLFAVFQTKPSPFCLLDEVDAPLDDNNVERFLMLLEDFRRNTQFIIITHNKLTMGVAQILYGLTMTDGVSKKLSVKFEEVDRQLDAAPRRAKAG